MLVLLARGSCANEPPGNPRSALPAAGDREGLVPPFSEVTTLGEVACQFGDDIPELALGEVALHVVEDRGSQNGGLLVGGFEVFPGGTQWAELIVG